VSFRYLEGPSTIDGTTWESVMTALDTVQKLGITAAAVLYALSNGVHGRRLLPIAAVAVIALLSFGPAAFHPELTAIQVLRSFVALSTTWVLLAARRTAAEAERQLLALSLLPSLNLLLGLLLAAAGLHPLMRHEFTGAWRLQGAAIPAYLGILCIIGVIAAMHAWSLGRRGSGLLVVLNSTVAILSGTRTAMALCLVVVLAGLVGRARLLHLRTTFPAAVIYALVLVASAYAYLPALRARFYGNPRETVVNTSGRADAWVFYWHTWAVDPAFGRGLGASTVANTGQLPSAFQVPHNEYLRLLVDGGWVGLTLYLLAASTALSPLVRRTAPARSRVGIAIAAWAVYCFVDNGLSNPHANATFPTLIAAVAAWTGSRGHSRPGDPAAPVVVYIAGVSRSGSTLVERALHRLPGVFCVGELHHVWERGARRNWPCSCRLPFLSCPFWTAVGARLGDGWAPERVDEILRLHRRAGRHRLLPLLMCHLLRGRRRREAESYCRSMASLYRAIAAESGARIIVDSSKLPMRAHLLAWSSLVDLRVIHLVRDSRAHAFAAQRIVERPEAPGEIMRRTGPLRCSLEWLAFHLMSSWLRGRVSRYATSSYEDFCRDPEGTLDALMWLFDRIGSDGVIDRDGDRALLQLRPWHAVSGNPLRFVEGPTPIRLDDQWQSALAIRDRALVTVLTVPGLLSHGYLRGRSSMRRPRRARGHHAGQAAQTPPVAGAERTS
jgi:O-antigen ligase